VIEPSLQPWQPVHLALERAQLLLGSEETEGVHLPPDNVINPRHFATSSLGDSTASAPDSYLLRRASLDQSLARLPSTPTADGANR
jgi:hypothetical protein